MKDNPYEPPAPFDAVLAEPAVRSAAEISRAMRVFHGLLGAYALLTVATIVAGFAGQAYLPAELQTYIAWQEEMELTGATLAMLVTALVASALILPAWLGMLFFWRPSRWLFLAAEMLLLVAVVLFGPSVTHGVEAALGSATQLVGGAILAMAFFSPVCERFRRRKPVP